MTQINQENIHTSNMCFDVDVEKLSQMKFASSVPRQNSISVQQKIMLEQIKGAVRKYIEICESLNVDCLKQETLLGVTLILSRFSTDLDETWKLFDDLCGGSDMMEKKDHEHIAQLVSSCNNADWKHLFENLDLAAEVEASDLMRNDVLSCLSKCMEEACLPSLGLQKLNLACKMLLNMSPTNTPAARMCETYLSSVCQAHGREVPHDLEVRVLKCLTMFHDYKIGTSQMLQALALVLHNMHVKPSFLESMRFALNEKADNYNLTVKQKSKIARPRLSEIVKNILRSKQDYSATFSHWTAVQKFGINTSVRMQKVLYFMRVQCNAVPRSSYLRHFKEKIADTVIGSTIDTIDPEPIISCIQSIRAYKHRVENLINFRTECLSALPTSVRAELKPANVLQLYIAAYQHPSIQNECLLSVLKCKCSYNLQQNIAQFVDKYEFETDPVLEALIDAIYALAVSK